MAPRAPDGAARNLWTRIASAAVLAPAAIGATWAGFPWFDLMVLAASAALAWEWARLCGYGRFDGPRDWIFVASVSVVVLLATAPIPVVTPAALALAGAFASLLAGLSARSDSAGWRAAGFLLITTACICLLQIRGSGSDGLRPIIWIFLVTWAADTGGYVVGRLVGGPKLAPRISPRKTWSGMVGGLLAAIAVGAAYPYGVATITALASASAALFVAGAAVAGDLLESAAKRRFRLKDSSALIPGHGGLLDRVDGLLLAVPVATLILSESWKWA